MDCRYADTDVSRRLIATLTDQPESHRCQSARHPLLFSRRLRIPAYQAELGRLYATRSCLCSR